MEWLLDWHVVNEPLVDMIKQLLGPVSFILLDLPEVGRTVEVTFVAFGLHLAHGQEGDRPEAVLFKDGFHISLVTVVNDAKEDWHL